MKRSQIAVLAAGGIVAGFIIVAAVGVRIALPQVDMSLPADSISESRDLTGFSAIEVRGNWRVNVTQGDAWQVELSYPDNRKGVIKAEVRGNRLILNRRTWFWFRGEHDPRFTAGIVMPELEKLELAGTGQVDLSGFQGRQLEVDIKGNVRLEGREGRYDALDLSVAGASEIDLRGVVVTNAEVNLAGTSDLTLAMGGGELSGSLAGAGQIRYYGSVSVEDVDISGIGRLNHVE